MPAKATIAKSQPKTCAETVYNGLAEVVFALRHKRYGTENRAVYGNQGQVDTQCVVEGRDEFVQEHFQNLHQSGNHADEGDEFQEGQVHAFNQRAVFQQRVNKLVGRDGQAEYERLRQRPNRMQWILF